MTRMRELRINIDEYVDPRVKELEEAIDSKNTFTDIIEESEEGIKSLAMNAHTIQKLCLELKPVAHIAKLRFKNPENRDFFEKMLKFIEYSKEIKNG